MKKPFHLLFLFFLFPDKVSAMTDSLGLTGNSGSSSFYIVTGFHFFNFSKLNNEISKMSFPEVNKAHSSYGAGGLGTVGKMIFGGEGYSFSNEQINDTGTTRSQGGMGLIYFGYKVVNSPHFDVYPIVGAGFGGVSITLLKSRPAMAFSNFLANPLNAGQIGLSALMVDISAGIDYRMNKKNSVYFGLRGGYNFSKGTDWKADNFYFVNAPVDKLSNFYVQLMIGVTIGNDAEGN